MRFPTCILKLYWVVHWSYIGIMEKQIMEATVLGLGFSWACSGILTRRTIFIFFWVYRGGLVLRNARVQATLWANVMRMGGCQNYGPFLDPDYNTAPNI